MKALVYTGIEKLELQELPEPVPAADEVRIKVHRCGICGSDVHGFLGKSGRRIPPMVMGHEFAGKIDICGKNVQSFVPGERVTAYPLLFCGDCEYCRIGRTNICPNRSFLGVFTCNGAMAEYVCVPAKNLVRIGDTVSFTEGALIEPLAVAIRAVKQAGDLKGRNLVIIGAGTIGLLILMVAKQAGAQTVLMTDLSDIRLGLAKRFGADTANPTKQDPADVLYQLTGRKQADITIEAVGSTPTTTSSIALLRSGGMAVWVGNSAKTVEIPMQEVVTRELTIQGTHVYTMKEYEEAVNLLTEKKIEAEALVSRTCSLTEAPLYFDQLAHDPEGLIKVMIAVS